MIRVVICDDQRYVREGLRLTLTSYPDMAVVGTTDNGRDVLKLVDEVQPDIVLMDLKMPGTPGTDAISELRRKYPTLAIIALTTYDDADWVMTAVRNGATGYLLKITPSDQLVKAIRGTLAGETYIDPGVAGMFVAHVRDQIPLQQQALPDLTARELEILRHIAQGRTNNEIAAALHLSLGTVKNYVSAIFRKLQVNDRTQAALIGVQHGLGKPN